MANDRNQETMKLYWCFFGGKSRGRIRPVRSEGLESMYFGVLAANGQEFGARKDGFTASGSCFWGDELRGLKVVESGWRWQTPGLWMELEASDLD